MIDLYYWTTPNGHKIAMFLEETGLAYRIVPVNIGTGAQFEPAFRAIAPNNRIPAIIDHAPTDGGAAIPVFWQMAGLGPMAGQNHHFVRYAPEKIPYAIERYVNETNRLYGVLNKRLADRAFIAGDYSIADIAAYPWVVPYEAQGQKLEDFPHLQRWFHAIHDRPATVRAYARAAEVNPQPQAPMTEQAKRVLFGQRAR